MRKRFNTKTTIIIVIIISLLLGLLLYIINNRTSKTSSPAGSSTVETYNPNKIDLTPASQEDKQYSMQKKEEAAKPQDSNTDSKKQVKPTLVGASQEGDTIVVRAYVGDIVESGGLCTIQLTQGTLSFTKTEKAYADATTTICNVTRITKAELPRTGAWDVQVIYNSEKASGGSDIIKIQVN